MAMISTPPRKNPRFSCLFCTVALAFLVFLRYSPVGSCFFADFTGKRKNSAARPVIPGSQKSSGG
jgi:hypothetical protein